MRHIRNLFFMTTWLVLMTGGPGRAQTYHFLTYGVENGLPDRFVYTINEDTDGFLWIGTGTELVRFNGKTFQTNLLPDSLKQSFVTSSYKDDLGHLWFGFNDGYVGFRNKKGFLFYDLRSSESRINGIVQDPYGKILVASQNGGMYRIDRKATDPVSSLDMDVTQISSLGISGKFLLIGTFDGLYVYRFTSEKDPPMLIKKISEIPSTRIQAIYVENDYVLIGTMDAGIYRLKMDKELEVDNPGSIWGVDKMNIKDIQRDSKGDYWISTFGHGLIHIHLHGSGFSDFIKEDYNKHSGLNTLNIQCVFEDFEKNIWIGSYGKGLILFPENAMLFFTFRDQMPGNNITALTAYGDKMILAGEGGLLIQDARFQGPKQLLTMANGLPPAVIKTLFVDQKHRLWIGTKGAGIYQWMEGDRNVHPVYQSGNILENTINNITGDSSHIWVGTANGILVFDYQGKLQKRFSTYEGLPYNNVNQVYLDIHHQAWVATMSDGLYVINANDSIYRKFKFPEIIARVQMMFLTQDHTGGFWIGSYGSGVIDVLKDTVFNFTEHSGLVSNYCYSLAVDSSGSIWVGHSTGISRIYPSNMKVRTYSGKQGVMAECNPNATCTDTSGRVWFGTTNGVIRFDPSRENTDTIPPRTNILSLIFSDKEVPVKQKIVMPYGRYRLRIDYLGISYRDPQEVTYQYKLENYDEHWSDLTNNTSAYYSRLEDGKYKFLLKAYNSAGYTTAEPVSILIIVKRPFWKTWWFILFSIAVLVGIVFMIIKIRERNHIKLEEYLKTELDKRTKEVIEKKDELEIKNKEITDSINYARRIQSSILPPAQRLIDIFPRSFVFYKPRDIVSGDFYWWGHVDKDRFLIVCADSTGHGVPGAFMSMIGSTLIKDLTHQGRYETPSQLLKFLDREITAALNQNLESDKSNDGMDIIVLEVNTHNQHIKFASAMRPVILFLDNELYYIRGNRSGIGGEFFGEKIFDDQEYYLNQGDTIYMFSDGYPDQFGGPKGKKFKMVRLKNLLEEIYSKPMDEQYHLIKRNFEKWKGDFMQIDDVLFMGIRF